VRDTCHTTSSTATPRPHGPLRSAAPSIAPWLTVLGTSPRNLRELCLSALSSLIAAVRRRPVVAGLLVAIVILGAALRVDKLGTGTRVSVDERSYLGIADNMVVHRSYAYGKDPLHWAPGTPFMFAAAMKLSGSGAIDQRLTGQKNVAVYAQTLVGTATIVAVFAFASWLGGAWAGLLAALMTAIYDPLVLVARSYLSEPLGGFFFVLAVFAICVAVARPARSWRMAAGAGALLGLAVLSRNDLLPLFGVLPGLAFLMAWRRESLRSGFRLAALLVAGAVITVAPWVTYASIEQHRFTPITTAGPSSLWVATYMPAGGRQILVKRQFMKEVCATFPDRQDACGVTATQMDMRLIFELLQRRHPGMTQDEAIQAELDRNIKDYAFGQPAKFANMLLDKSTRIWGKPWGGGAIGRMESSVTQHHLLLGLTLLGMFAGLFFAGRRRRYVLLGFAALLTVTALNTIFVSESRMSLRMTPLFFAVGIGGLGATVRARRGDDEPLEVAASGPDNDEPQAEASTTATRDSPLRDDEGAADESEEPARTPTPPARDENVVAPDSADAGGNLHAEADDADNDADQAPPTSTST